MKKKYSSFVQFYPFYLRQHSNRVCRRLHFIGTATALMIVVASIAKSEPLLLPLALVAGYGFAWLGHFFFEKNRPATFTYPLYSFIGDWVMFRDIVLGKIKF